MSLAYVRCHHLGDFARADAHADHALARATALGDPALLAPALAMQAMLDFMRGRPIDWAQVERSVALEDRGRLLPLQLQPRLLAPQLRLGVGELGVAREGLTAIRAALVDAGEESELALVVLWLAWLETLAGDLAAAATLAEEAVRHAELTESERDRAWALAQRALVHAHRGDVAAARADAVAAEAACARLGASEPLLWSAASVGLLELSLGNPGAAWAAMAPLAERIDGGGVGPIGFLPDALEALIGLGELDRADACWRTSSAAGASSTGPGCSWRRRAAAACSTRPAAISTPPRPRWSRRSPRTSGSSCGSRAPARCSRRAPSGGGGARSGGRASRSRARSRCSTAWAPGCGRTGRAGSSPGSARGRRPAS